MIAASDGDMRKYWASKSSTSATRPTARTNDDRSPVEGARSMESTPATRFAQYSSTLSAPGKRQASPMIAISVAGIRSHQQFALDRTDGVPGPVRDTCHVGNVGFAGPRAVQHVRSEGRRGDPTGGATLVEPSQQPLLTATVVACQHQTAVDRDRRGLDRRQPRAHEITRHELTGDVEEARFGR